MFSTKLFFQQYTYSPRDLYTSTIVPPKYEIHFGKIRMRISVRVVANITLLKALKFFAYFDITNFSMFSAYVRNSCLLFNTSSLVWNILRQPHFLVWKIGIRVLRELYSYARQKVDWNINSCRYQHTVPGSHKLTISHIFPNLAKFERFPGRSAE